VDALTGRFGIKEHLEMDVGSVVGTHVGPGAAGIAYIAKD
jgi:fatty acid-binding protein DegV